MQLTAEQAAKKIILEEVKERIKKVQDKFKNVNDFADILARGIEITIIELEDMIEEISPEVEKSFDYDTEERAFDLL
jgi:predicted HTH domain antitoxin